MLVQSTSIPIDQLFMKYPIHKSLEQKPANIHWLGEKPVLLLKSKYSFNMPE
jgi:hypothetical protein